MLLNGELFLHLPNMFSVSELLDCAGHALAARCQVLQQRAAIKLGDGSPVNRAFSLAFHNLTLYNAFSC